LPIASVAAASVSPIAFFTSSICADALARRSRDSTRP
jgi:hypothetical protein